MWAAPPAGSCSRRLALRCSTLHPRLSSPPGSCCPALRPQFEAASRPHRRRTRGTRPHCDVAVMLICLGLTGRVEVRPVWIWTGVCDGQIVADSEAHRIRRWRLHRVRGRGGCLGSAPQHWRPSPSLACGQLRGTRRHDRRSSIRPRHQRRHLPTRCRPVPSAAARVCRRHIPICRQRPCILRRLWTSRR